MEIGYASIPRLAYKWILVSTLIRSTAGIQAPIAILMNDIDHQYPRCCIISEIIINLYFSSRDTQVLEQPSQPHQTQPTLIKVHIKN